MKKHLVTIALLSLISTTLFLFNGCATIFGWGKAEVVNVRSNPDKANIVITDETGAKIFEGATPTNISLEKKKGFFSGKTYSLTISKEGYANRIVTIDTKANGWYIGGNIIFGGLIGWLIVDPATGAMWTLDTNEVNVELEQSGEGALIDHNGMKVVSIQDVPANLRDKLVRLDK